MLDVGGLTGTEEEGLWHLGAGGSSAEGMCGRGHQGNNAGRFPTSSVWPSVALWTLKALTPHRAYTPKHTPKNSTLLEAGAVIVQIQGAHRNPFGKYSYPTLRPGTVKDGGGHSFQVGGPWGLDTVCQAQPVPTACSMHMLPPVPGLPYISGSLAPGSPAAAGHWPVCRNFRPVPSGWACPHL